MVDRTGPVPAPLMAAGDDTFRVPLRATPAMLRASIAGLRMPVFAPARRAADLVDLARFDPALVLDIRYATARNFLGFPVYPAARAFLQRPAARALSHARGLAARHGYGLLVYDAYRPWHVSALFRHAVPESLYDFVGDPAHGSRHNRGCAVDLTLWDLTTRQVVPMPSGFDEMTPRAHVGYAGGSARARGCRDLLATIMQASGFEPLAEEWWHFDFRDWRDYAVMDLSFDEIGRTLTP
ncbi:D-alanyl-D-alanine dipeptidase [Komagataeibacter rhaeticus]|uniref:M15 family metallopeptidase n=1 Tax=Komagataeibacter rhaeticus TaxID=215221 RepID=UPI0004D793BC|nr:M15 family metallopeptidase [Komagataeibacter rhaeticus]KDU96522.1 D-alanyl-D-alanine dipeptidase [Komagataeibacter rhaeticus AF1]MBL7239753.1 M15 family metallopeptidase [Komagataeibacter rhaeticus]PYD52749.1 D-alanyl-D-alanine dipeptidase [Komagataeibacter rhaeticus]GBQ11406.1 peptidase M15D [Komagataeibacter rhaeticus DSM 16663]